MINRKVSNFINNEQLIPRVTIDAPIQFSFIISAPEATQKLVTVDKENALALPARLNPNADGQMCFSHTRATNKHQVLLLIHKR